MPMPVRTLVPLHRRTCAVALACLLGSSIAHGEIYKFVDENGHVTYTNMPRPGAKQLDLGPVPKVGAIKSKPEKKRSSAGNPTPAGFPRVDPGTQRKRDDMRRQLLVEELASEQRNLTAALSAYAAGRRQPGSDQTRLMDAVRLHEKNIEMLNKELGHLR